MATKRHLESSQQNPAMKRRLHDSSLEGINQSFEGEGGELSDDATLGNQSISNDEFHDNSATASKSPSKKRQQQDTMIREQDRFLPIANVSRIMKRVLPESGKVAKDAKECVQECVSEFISFITSEASERCLNEKRKTINGEDILWAMQTLGFDPYIEPLKVYLAKYRLWSKGERHSGGAVASVSPGYGTNIVMLAEEGDPKGGRHHTGAAVYENVVLDSSIDQRQVRMSSDGHLIIEMRGDNGGGVASNGDGIGTPIALPVMSGTSHGGNGTQQFILTTLDQSAIGGSGVQQFAIPAGAQLAFIPAGGGPSTSATTAQGIPVMFVDSHSSGNTSNQQQYITMNASGSGGLQFIQLAPSSVIGGSTAGQAESSGNELSNTETSTNE